MQKSDKTNHVFLSLIKWGLVTYTAIRSIDLVMSTMPASIKIFAVAVVCGLDLALLAWDDYAAHRSKSGTQHTIGVIMIVVNMLGIGAAMVADTAMVIDAENSHGMITTIALFIIPAIVLSNVGAIIAVGQADPDRVLAEAQAKHERELAMKRAQHDRDLVNQRQALELELEKLSNTTRLDTLKDDYIRSLSKASGKPANAMQSMAAEAEVGTLKSDDGKSSKS